MFAGGVGGDGGDGAEHPVGVVEEFKIIARIVQLYNDDVSDHCWWLGGRILASGRA